MFIIYTDTMYIIVLQIDQPTSVNLLLSAQNLEEDLPTTMYWDSSSSSSISIADQSDYFASSSDVSLNSPNVPPFSPLSNYSLDSIESTETLVTESMPLSNQGSINPSTPQKPKLQTPVHVHADTWYGFKIVGDNLDQDVKPRFMRLDRPTRSLHYFNLYAVRDRINLSDVTDKIPIPTAKTVKKMDVLPTANDTECLLNNFVVLTARILITHMSYFNDQFRDSVDSHIGYVYSKEVCKK